jgi:hypothetical protein
MRPHPTCYRAQLLKQQCPVLQGDVQLVVHGIQGGLHLTHHIILAAQVGQQRSPAADGVQQQQQQTNSKQQKQTAASSTLA